MLNNGYLSFGRNWEEARFVGHDSSPYPGSGCPPIHLRERREPAQSFVQGLEATTVSVVMDIYGHWIPGEGKKDLVKTLRGPKARPGRTLSVVTGDWRSRRPRRNPRRKRDDSTIIGDDDGDWAV